MGPACPGCANLCSWVRLSKCGDIWKWWWVHCRTRCPIHCKGLLLARGQLASSGRRLWAGQVPFPGENISRLGKGEHWAWQALQGITRMPLPNQPVLRLARSIQMRSTENGPCTHLHIHCRNWKHLQVFQYVSSQGLVFLISKSERVPYSDLKFVATVATGGRVKFLSAV